jgi:hypothetical protein
MNKMTGFRNKHFQFDTFEAAFIGINSSILSDSEYQNTSRLGNVLEVTSLLYEVKDISSYQFSNEKLGRIDYHYADLFYQWMIGGCTDNDIILKDYPGVARFMEKPKSADLPANFNTFYGPRILQQLPHIEKELSQYPDTRRAVISILEKDDLLLLDRDETLEFPCCESATFFIRNDQLNIHLHMRSQNMGQVLKLDMYLWGRFTCELAERLKLKLGHFSSSVTSAHIFEKDIQYIKSITQ